MRSVYLAVILLVIAICVSCGIYTLSAKKDKATNHSITQVVRADPQFAGKWMTPPPSGTISLLPVESRTVKLLLECSNRGEIGSWANKELPPFSCLTFCQDNRWCLVLFSTTCGRNTWNALFYEYYTDRKSDTKPWKLVWLGYDVVEPTSGQDIAWVTLGKDSQSLIFTSSNGKVIRVEILPKPIRS